MFERLSKRVQSRAEALRKQAIARIATISPPPGVGVAESDEGVTLSGRRLKRRFIADIRLREWFR